MSNWDILGDDSVSTSANDDVEYVGMVEEEDVPPVRVPRRPVRRVSRPMRRATNRAPAYAPGPQPTKPMKPMQPMSNGKEQLFYMPTESGAEVALNAEALQNMQAGGVQEIGGRTARRIQPGTYVTYGPGHGPSGHMSGGMGGGMGDDIDVGALVGGIGSGISDLIGAIGQTVVSSREQRLQAELERERLQAEQEAAAAAREVAEAESEREHELAMERLRQRQEELAELQRTGAQLDSGAPPPVLQQQGTSPVVWVLLAVLGIGGIGGIVWFATRKKDDED